MSRSRQRGAALVVAVVLMSCGPPPTPLASTPSTEITRWEDLFSAAEEIPLQLPSDGPSLVKIGQVSLDPSGSFVLPDSRGERILFFEGDGRLSRVLRSGEGGDLDLTVLRAGTLDAAGNYLVFDPDGRWVTVVPPAENRNGQPVRFQIDVALADLVALPDGTIVTYSPGERKVFHRFDRAGDRLRKVHRIEDEDLSIFYSRIQTGGVTTVGDEIFGIHPATYEIVRMNPDLDVVARFRAAEEDQLQPGSPAFPDRLSPYDYTPRHEKWWDEFDHIGAIHTLLDDLLAVTVFSSQSMAAGTEAINLYRTNGDVLALGLTVPQEGRVVGAVGHQLLVAREATLEEDGVTRPFALFRYRVRPEALEALDGSG